MRANRNESLREENLPPRGSLGGPPKTSERYTGNEDQVAKANLSEVFGDPLGGGFSSQRLSVLLPLIVLPLIFLQNPPKLWGRLIVSFGCWSVQDPASFLKYETLSVSSMAFWQNCVIGSRWNECLQNAIKLHKWPPGELIKQDCPRFQYLKNLWGFSPLKQQIFSKVVLKDPPKYPLKQAYKMTSWGSCVVIFISLTEAPLTDPTTTPPNTPETDPKRTRNRPETEPNGAEQSRTEPNGAEMDRNQALSGGTAGGVCRDGEGWRL